MPHGGQCGDTDLAAEHLEKVMEVRKTAVDHYNDIDMLFVDL